MSITNMFFILLLMIGYSVPNLAGISEPIAGENSLKEAVKLLQVTKMSRMKDELKILRHEKEESQRAKLTLEKNVEQLKKDKDKEIKITKEKYEKQIKELKA